MFSTALRNLWAHKVRLGATALSIMLAVAFVAGTLVLTATMRKTFDNLFADVYRGTDAVVRAKAAFEGPQGSGAQRGRVDAALVPKLQSVDGVRAAEGAVGGYARLIGKDGKALGNPATGTPTIGGAWSENSAKVRHDQLRRQAGRLADRVGQAVVGSTAAGYRGRYW